MEQVEKRRMSNQMPMNRDARICIVGAGAAGIAAAQTLRRLGYRRITILEQRDRVGGKCWTVIENDRPLDLAATYVPPNYTTVRRFAQQAGVRLRLAAPFEHLGLDGRRRPYGRPPKPYPLIPRIAEFLRLGLELNKARTLFDVSVGEADLALVRRWAIPYAQWVKEGHWDYFHQVAYPLLRSWGFGYEEYDVPALYTLQALPYFAPGGNILRLWDLSRVPLYHIEEGYGELWRRLAEPFDVRLNTTIRRIERSEDGGVIHTDQESVEFDWLILACPLKKALAFLDASEEEDELFSALRQLEVWQALVPVDGLPDALILDSTQTYDQAGRTLGFFRQRPDTKWCYFFGYTRPDLSDEATRAGIERDIQSLGGTLLGPMRFTRWDYFPHYASQQLAAGYHARQYYLQGKRNTLYVGESVTPFGVEMVAQHAVRIIHQHFDEAKDATIPAMADELSAIAT